MVAAEFITRIQCCAAGFNSLTFCSQCLKVAVLPSHIPHQRILLGGLLLAREESCRNSLETVNAIEPRRCVSLSRARGVVRVGSENACGRELSWSAIAEKPSAYRSGT